MDGSRLLTWRGRQHKLLQDGDVESQWAKPIEGLSYPEQSETHTHTFLKVSNWSREGFPDTDATPGLKTMISAGIWRSSNAPES